MQQWPKICVYTMICVNDKPLSIKTYMQLHDVYAHSHTNIFTSDLYPHSHTHTQMKQAFKACGCSHFQAFSVALAKSLQISLWGAVCVRLSLSLSLSLSLFLSLSVCLRGTGCVRASVCDLTHGVSLCVCLSM